MAESAINSPRVQVKSLSMIEGRTKIIATLGPALDAEGVLERLLDSGVDVLRVNLSHAPPRDQAARVRRARAHRPDIAVLADLGGPKLRLGELREEIKIRSGDTITLGAGGVPVADPSLYDRVRAGDPVYIADGTLDLVTIEVASDRVICRVRVGGTLRSRKGINLPMDTSSLPALTEKDRDRPRRHRRARARLHRALVRAPRKGHRRRAHADQPADHRQDREAAGAGAHRPDPRGDRRDHGGARRSRRRDPDREGAGDAEEVDPRRQPRWPAGHHRDPDAGVDGVEPAADARRGHRRRQRRARRHRRGDAVRGDRGRPRPGGARCR